MRTKTVALFLLSGLLAACTVAAPGTPLVTAISPMASPSPSQFILPRLTPTTWLTQTPIPTLAPTATAHPLLERDAQVGGGINGITLIGDVAYVGMGPRLAAIDISQHAHPQLISKSDQLPGLVTQLLKISNESAPYLIISTGKYLVLVDISNPDRLKPVYQLELEGPITALAWDAETSRIYAGVAYYQRPTVNTGIISSIDVTADHQLKVINSVPMPEFPLSLAVGRESLFAGAQGYAGGLYHVHLNSSGTLFKPHQVISSGQPEPLQPLYMQVIGNRLYLGYREIEAYDISNPDQPLKVWSHYVPGCDILKSFSVVGEQAYAFGWTILSVFMHGAITLPEPITGAPMGESSTITAVHHGDFVVANNDLVIYDTDNPQDLQKIGSYQEPVMNAYDAAAGDRVIYLLDIGDGGSTTQPILRVLSLPDLQPLGQVTTELTTWYNFAGMALEGDRLYLGNESGLWAYDVGNTSPVLLGKVDVLDGTLEAITAIKVDERRLLVTSQVDADKFSVLKVFDVTDLQKPVLLGDPLPLRQGYFAEMAWLRSDLYVLLDPSYFANNDGLYFINFNKDILELKKSMDVEDYTDLLAVDNKIIMLAGFDKPLIHSFVSLFDPETLNLLSRIELPLNEKGLAILGDMALVVVGYSLDGYQSGAAQLLIYDVEDPTNPKQLESMDIAESMNYRVPILVTTSYLILINGSAGLEVLEYTH